MSWRNQESRMLSHALQLQREVPKGDRRWSDLAHIHLQQQVAIDIHDQTQTLLVEGTVSDIGAWKWMMGS